jgi:hypothetical protein
LDEPSASGDIRYSLLTIPDGLQTLNGVTFDLRGYVQGAGQRASNRKLAPLRVNGIPVKQRFNKLHVLQAALGASRSRTFAWAPISFAMPTADSGSAYHLW